MRTRYTFETGTRPVKQRIRQIPNRRIQEMYRQDDRQRYNTTVTIRIGITNCIDKKENRRAPHMYRL